MYRDEPGARRFLVADEVGLGKTMVARGVVAKVLDELWDSVDRIDIVYICSNGSIARQNIRRLNVTEAKDAALPSRITLLPKMVHGLQSRKVNFISLTPQTSFDLRSSLGTFEERALLHYMLPVEWTSAKGSRNALQGGMNRDRFHRHVDGLASTSIDPLLLKRFHEQLGKDPELGSKFKDLCDRFVGFKDYSSVSEESRARQSSLVGALRMQLAISCLHALEPDLVVIDEFQRFKYLLDGTDQAGALANDLFSFGDARVLLLSATPYKMYTTGDEQTDDHYRDFLQTVEFLQNDKERTVSFRASLDEYRRAIFRVGEVDDGVLRERKELIEQALRNVMVRTERLAVRADRSGMLTEVSPRLRIAESDIGGYLAAARVARAVGHYDVIEYWKSSPYLLNFMDDYQFKQLFTAALDDETTRKELDEIIRSEPSSLLDWNTVERFLEVDSQNSRMRALVSDYLDSGAWRLLWLPPALTYYKLAGAYADVQAENLTKRLIFSSWHVVPKAVAALLSYEVERRIAGSAAGVPSANTQEERKKRQGLLRFGLREATASNMPVLGLLYPSIVLAELGDPLVIAREVGEWPTIENVLTHSEERLREALNDLTEPVESEGAEDERWYWAAPILLDLQRHRAVAHRWLRQANLADLWINAQPDDSAPHEAEDDSAGEAWKAHVAAAVRLADGGLKLGRRPANLARVLAILSLGAPGCVALRALGRISGGSPALTDPHLRNESGWVAWGFRSLFNLPEVATLVRSLNEYEPYWLRVAEYCANGGLQAVLDEYAHVLLEYEAVSHKPAAEATKQIAKVMASALQLRTANVGVDEIVAADDGLSRAGKRTMRARFAARFGARQTEEGAGAIRQDDVRLSFNSPFWPFVLCSTSVGQEGLDFHLYCHAVVHWNLPSNPVDLEQREGRVHRYKGHAVRKNVVRKFRDALLATDDPEDHGADPWEDMFHRAVVERAPDEGDLVPFWVLPVEGGAKIERHVPALPLSRELGQLTALKRALTLYRMAFGQNRQEDVVAYLQKKCSPERLEQIAAELRVDLAPPDPKLTTRPAVTRRVASRQVSPDAAGINSPVVDKRLEIENARDVLDKFRECASRLSSPP
jgi:hypothetical protein